MPYLRIQTNLGVGEADQKALVTEASALVARDLGKPASYVMTAIEPGVRMLFAGADTPAAFLELKSIGLSAAQAQMLSRSLTGMIEARLRIPPGRVYVQFADVPHNMWGWNGGTF